MNAWPDELRLIAAIVTNGLMLAAGWRIARRASRRFAIALPDTLLFWLAGQYVIAGVCGMLGMMWPGVMLAVGCAVSVGVLVATGRNTENAPPSPQPSPGGRGSGETRIAITALAFVLAYASGFIHHQRWIPEFATDPLVYHVPAAAHWVQDGRISLVDFWYWLPANSYSPLAGSVWIAWWMAPIGNDALSRYVQLPTWILLFAASLRLLRDLRVPIVTAAIAAVTVVIARPFWSQLTYAKDDIGVAALAITLLGGLHARRLRDGLAPVRLGLAFGLLISLKYPAVLACVVAAPAILTFRWWRALRLRGTLLAGGIALLLVVPWLIRNAIVTGGNPFYPFFSGSGGFLPDPDLRSPAGVWKMLAQSYHAPRWPVWMLFALAAGWLIARHGRSFLRRDDGVRRSLLLGPALAIVLLVVTFPWPEIRYLFSAIAALLILVGVACGTLRPRGVGVAAAIVALLVTFLSAFDFGLDLMSQLALVALVIAGITFFAQRRLMIAPQQVRIAAACAAGAAMLMSIYVYWLAYLRVSGETFKAGSDIGWQIRYAEIAPIWTYVRNELPPGSTIAYANTPYTWPLFGFDLQHKVVHAPVKPGVRHLHDVPPIREKVAARDEYIAATRQQNEGADLQTWLDNLERLQADFLLIDKRESSPDPPELRFVAARPERFERVAENEAAIVYRIRR